MNLKIYCSTQAAVSLTIKFFDNNKNEIKTLSGNFLNVNDNAIPIKDIIDYLKIQNIKINLKHWFFFSMFINDSVQSVSSNNECTIYLKEGIVNNNFQTSLAPEYEEDQRGNIDLKKEYCFVQVNGVKKIQLKSGYKLDANGKPCLKFGYALDKQGEPYLKKEVLAIGGVSGLGILGLIVYMFLIRKKSDNKPVKNNKPILKNEDIKSKKISSLDNLLIGNKEI